MAATTPTKVSLRLLIDGKRNKVLFAEASKEFVDFLCSLLSLPMATVIRILSKRGMVGSLGDLYESIENLSESYLTSEAKDALLKPEVYTSEAALPPLLPMPKIQSSKSTTFYGCGSGPSANCSSAPAFGFGSTSCTSSHVSNDPTVVCPESGRSMSRPLTFVNPPNKNCTFEGGYVRGGGGVATYMIMDNLEVRPMSTISAVTMLNQFDVKDIGVLEEKVVDVSMDQGMEFLKVSLQSKAVLTEVFLGKKPSS